MISMVSIFLAVWVFPAVAIIIPFIVLAGFGLVSLAKVGIIDSLRYDAITRSPINSVFAASIANLPTIRAYGHGGKLRCNFENSLLENNGRAYFTYACFSRWLGFYVDVLSLIFIIGCMLIAYFQPSSD